MKKIYSLFIFCLLLTSCRFGNSQKTQSNDSEFITIPYLENTGSDLNLTSLDIYLPESVNNAPVMMYVHGGGWSSGDKRPVDFKDDVFTQAGYIFISVNYRLSPEVDFPTQAEDVASAISWAHKHIVQYGGDPNQIYLMGHSAGAHLVALVSTDESYLKNNALDLSVIKGTIPLDTQGYDIALLMQNGSHNIYENVFGTEPAMWDVASPINYVIAEKNIPPMAITWSGDNKEERETQAFNFISALKNSNVYAVGIDGSNKTHMEINQQFGEVDDVVTQQVFEFLNFIQIK